jgi:hypothetical protein
MHDYAIKNNYISKNKNVITGFSNEFYKNKKSAFLSVRGGHKKNFRN